MTDAEEKLEDKYLNKIFGFTDELPPPPMRDVNHVSVIPRMNGKSFQAEVLRNPSDHSFMVAGMKVGEEEFFNVVRALGDEDKAIAHFMELAHQHRQLAGYYGGSQQRHGSGAFNPRTRRRGGQSQLMDRFTSMDRREQDVILLLAQRFRDTYMPHHKGRQMEPWSEMDRSRQVKWIEMAVVAVRELDKIGLLR